MFWGSVSDRYAAMGVWGVELTGLTPAAHDARGLCSKAWWQLPLTICADMSPIHLPHTDAQQNDVAILLPH